MHFTRTSAFLFYAGAVALTFAGNPPAAGTRPETPNATRRIVTGPSRTMNIALAAGATAEFTLQPVMPKTVPASDYPPGTTISGTTISLGSVPARVWLEIHATAWAPDELKVMQVKIDATDEDGDGGGFSGANAECGGSPVIGAGDITWAMQACSRTCQGNPNVSCETSSDCTAAGTSGPCIGLNNACRSNISGIASPCAFGEPSRCSVNPPGFPPGMWCDVGFHDLCDPQSISIGTCTYAIVSDELNKRFGIAVEAGCQATDFGPSYLGTIVLDVPAGARGSYTIDMNDAESYMLNPNAPPNDQIPIAALNPAIIRILDCIANGDCDDGDACTADLCQNGCCTSGPIAGWNPAVDCCNPANGALGAIPPSTSCRIGGCSLGGSYGSPTQTPVPDGTTCTAQDPCFLDGQCAGGGCQSEQFPGPSCPKPRFITMEPNTGGTPSAFRVRLVSLHHPNPPYTGGAVADFTAFEGQYRWVGPHSVYPESTANPTPLFASSLQCNPYYSDWTPVSLLHIGGADVVPSSTYEIQMIAQGLDVDNEANYSSPMVLMTGRWGDVVSAFSPPSASQQPDYTDVSGLVNKFKSAPGAPSKARALLAGVDSEGHGVVNLAEDVGFTEISKCVDAFHGRGYPYLGPIDCP